MENTVKKQSSMTFDDFTNFLSSGAVVRWQNEWYLFWNLSAVKEVSSSGQEFQDGIYSCDFISGQIFNQSFSQSIKLTPQKYKEILDQYQAIKGLSLSHENYSFEPEWKPIDKDLFRESFEKIKGAMQSGKVTKAVPICYQNGHLLGSESQVNQYKKITFLNALFDSQDNLIPYGQWSENNGFLGMTPELFFNINDCQLSTMALAGTSAKETPLQDFLSDKKELLEHEIVIKDITEKLKPFGTCHVSQTYVAELPYLNHLKTDIKVQLHKDYNFLELLKKMHPTSALGIYPNSDYWQEFIKLPNQELRNSFGAPWGFKIQGQILLVVGIRRIEWEENNIRIPAGCGVISASEFEREFAEIERKINSVKKVFTTKNRLREVFANE